MKGLGAAAVGAVGLSRLGSGVEAAKGGDNACATFCATVFGDTKAAGQCTSQAAHGAGPCLACGGNPANYCHGVCCASGETCQGGACVPTATICAGPVDFCSTPYGCHGNDICSCASTPTGTGFCASSTTCHPCSSDADCQGTGYATCAVASCCSSGTVCANPCPT